MVVPKEVEAMMLAWYRIELNRRDRACASTKTTSAAANRAVPARYPQSRVIVPVSPLLSHSVVARTLMIQNPRVIAGTLLQVPS
jgi:hypothetical protein